MDKYNKISLLLTLFLVACFISMLGLTFLMITFEGHLHLIILMTLICFVEGLIVASVILEDIK